MVVGGCCVSVRVRARATGEMETYVTCKETCDGTCKEALKKARTAASYLSQSVDTHTIPHADDDE